MNGESNGETNAEKRNHSSWRSGGDWKRGCAKGVILLVCIANAARVCDIMIFQEIEITVPRRLENVGLTRNASSSSSLETHVSSGKGR
jgi:hypothetical protein